ncbi:MAG: acyl-CoA thioesterase [Eubacteriales bacterium]|nr:acyl-CoA thioesterase [Eubacteriales bacterium]
MNYIHKVQYYETDKMGVVHHSNYIRWMEEARIDYLDRMGYSYAKLEEEGIISPVTGIQCKYQKPTTFGEIVSIDVSVKEFRGVRLSMEYHIFNEKGDLVFDGISEHCFIDAEGKLLRLKKLHPDFYELLTTLAAKNKE